VNYLNFEHLGISLVEFYINYVEHRAALRGVDLFLDQPRSTLLTATPSSGDVVFGSRVRAVGSFQDRVAFRMGGVLGVVTVGFRAALGGHFFVVWVFLGCQLFLTFLEMRILSIHEYSVFTFRKRPGRRHLRFHLNWTVTPQNHPQTSVNTSITPDPSRPIGIE
jgi:hypothetical protein